MFLVAGLGNPGKEYEKTRHNAGFLFLDFVSDIYGIPIDQVECQALTGRGKISGEDVLLAKPLTYMNRSGSAVRQLVSKYSVSPERLIVVYDDVDLDPGVIRIRPKGGSGGHRGVQSIISSLKRNDFGRIRIGIGRPTGRSKSVTDYVLEEFSEDEFAVFIMTAHRAAQALSIIISEGYDAAMSRFNSTKSENEVQSEP